jgi:demethylmenaquinone methyltransferase/2-methoxy-6-polyprenyl-1,4-benzoquinol methylase
MPMKNPKQANRAIVQARYDTIAKWYDVAARLTLSHRSDAVHALEMQEGERILDLACGTGINFELIRVANPNGLLLGLDYSLGVLAQAQARLKRKRWDNVVLDQGNAAELPFADATFDRVLCTYALKAIPSHQQTLDEVHRVLKPNGVFVVMDATLGNGVPRFFNPLIHWIARGFLYEIDRPLIDEIARRFQDVQSAKYDFGYTVVIVAQKK